MAVSIQKLTNLYILSTFGLFGYTFSEVYRKADNYFSAGLIYLDDTLTNFIFYNMIFSLGILFYKACVWLFLIEVKENQTIKMVDKLKAKIIDVILFCYIMQGEIEMNSFACIVFIFFSYILHCMAMFRADYLIHTPASLSLNLNYRLAALLLIILFCDYEMLVYSFDLLYSQNATHFIFVYYTIITSLSIVEPTFKYFFDFYEKYTFCHVKNADQKLALLSLWINVPRLLIQIFLSICLAIKFSIFFYLLFTIIELVSQLSHTIKSYNRVKKLTDTMKNLKKIEEEQIKKHHDNTCMVCFQQMTEATLLPCKHFFHDECLRQWIIKNSNHFCPKCKKQFNFDNKKQENKQIDQEKAEIKNQRQLQQKIRQQRLKRLKKLEEKIKYKQDIKKYKKHLNEKKLVKQQKINQKQEEYQIKPQRKNMVEKKEQIQKQQLQHQIYELYKRIGQDSGRQTEIYSQAISKCEYTIKDSIWNTPLQVIQQMQRKRRFVRMGSLAYGLPTEAVYRRTYKHMYVRDQYECVNDDLMTSFSLKKVDQIMMFADQ